MKNKIKNLLFDSNKGKIKLNDRASIFFFCLALSTFFWFLSSLSKKYSTDLSIPITYTSYNKDFILVDEPPQSLVVRVTGNGFELLGEQMSLNQTEIKVDLSKARKSGKNSYALATQSLRTQVLNSLDKDLVFERMTIDSLLFSTDKRVTKKLKVIPDLELNFESSFNLNGDVSIIPNEIEVSGPKAEMDSLEFISTTKLSTNDLEDSLIIEDVLNENEKYTNLTFNPEKVKIIIPVTKFTEKIFNLPIKINSKRGDIITFPNEVKVICLVPLSSYESLEQSSISAEVNFNLGSEQLKKLAVKVKGIPSYAKLLRVEPEKVEFIIKK